MGFFRLTNKKIGIGLALIVLFFVVWLVWAIMMPIPGDPFVWDLRIVLLWIIALPLMLLNLFVKSSKTFVVIVILILELLYLYLLSCILYWVFWGRKETQ
jgi:hypothetical protein